jgi:hypothetical protein
MCKRGPGRAKVRSLARNTGKNQDEVYWNAREEAAAKLKDRKGLWESLTPEQQAAALAYDGPEIIGTPQDELYERGLPRAKRPRKAGDELARETERLKLYPWQKPGLDDGPPLPKEVIQARNDGSLRYWPSKRPRKAPEQAFHCQVARYLERALPEGFWWSTFPAGGGGRVRGARLKAMGLKAGCPDVLLFGPERVGWLELKTKTGSLSAVQKAVHAELRELGHTIETVRSLDEVQDALMDFCAPYALKARVA